MGPNLFVRNENIAHVMPCGTAYAMTSCIVQCVHAGKPATLCICGMPGITYGCAIHASQTTFIKINCRTFWHPKHKICKPEHAGKDSRCHAQCKQGRLR